MPTPAKSFISVCHFLLYPRSHLMTLLDFPPRYHSTPNGPVLSVPGSQIPSLSDAKDNLSKSGRERLPPPLTPYEFLPDLLAKTEKNFKLRDDVKPLHVVQPEGVSFKITGHELEWQNWKMHIGKYEVVSCFFFLIVLNTFAAFSQREGIVLSTITYNDHGEVRPIFYRLSLAEMVVPYGAPEYPHPRKFAFDRCVYCGSRLSHKSQQSKFSSGEYGMGTMANELSLGCDCLGQIHYLVSCAVLSQRGSLVFTGNNY